MKLPDFKTTWDAEEFGRYMTRDQFIFLAGARAALQREFDSLIKAETSRYTWLQFVADLAFKIQLLREALDEAPQATLFSVFPERKLVPETSSCVCAEINIRHCPVHGQ